MEKKFFRENVMTIQKAELDEFDFQVEFSRIPWKLNLVDETLARCEFYSDFTSKKFHFWSISIHISNWHFKIVFQNMDIFWQKLNIFCVKLIKNNPTVVPKIDPFETKEDPKQMNLELRRFIYENVCLDEENKSCFFVFPWNCLHFHQSLFWMT